GIRDRTVTGVQTCALPIYLVARRRNVLEQLLHQLVDVIGELFQHAETRLLLAIEMLVERHDLGRSMFLVDDGPLQREVDEAGDEIGRASCRERGLGWVGGG